MLPFHFAFLAIASCWMWGSWWPSWILFSAALFLSLGSHLTASGLLIVATVGLALAAVRTQIARPAVARLLVFLLTLPLLLAPSLDVPGFAPLPVLSEVRLSKDAAVYSFNLHIGPLVFGFFYCRLFLDPPTFGEVMNLLRWVAVLTLAAAAVLLGSAFALGYVNWDPKLPSFAQVWTLSNLFFVSVPEECLFRGLLQGGLAPWGRRSAWVIASLLFGLFHFQGGLENVLLATIAGFFFGYAYLRTGRIESAILLHFIVNTVHFYLFTYPRLA